MRIDEVLQRIQGEYVEMPGLRLTPAQARRLWGLESDVCTALLGSLVDARFLVKTGDGAFVRSQSARVIETVGARKASGRLGNTHRCRSADFPPRQPIPPARYPQSRALGARGHVRRRLRAHSPSAFDITS